MNKTINLTINNYELMKYEYLLVYYCNFIIRILLI